jgi:hypothetical protein
MTSSNWGLFALAAAIAFVGALWAGVPLAGLAPLLIVLACPLMMVFMMKGMHGGGEHDHRDTRDEHLRH